MRHEARWGIIYNLKTCGSVVNRVKNVDMWAIWVPSQTCRSVGYEVKHVGKWDTK